MQLTRFILEKITEGEAFPFSIKATDVRIDGKWEKTDFDDDVSWKWFYSRKIHALSQQV
jgi:hypothetical protein